MILGTQKQYYTPEEYLALEDQSLERNEYRDGEIISMAGGTTNHNEIITNLTVYLKPLLKPQRCKIFTENVRIWIARYQVFTYPDVMIIEGDLVYYGEGKTTVINPSIIFEVASKSTKNYDQGDKFDYYRGLASLKEYILIEQSSFRVMHYEKTLENQWLLTEYQSPEDILPLNYLSLTIPIREIYDGLNL